LGPNRKGGRWPGGYVSRQRGRDTYVIERSVRGVKFHVSTRAHGIRAALAQLERFEANPESYRPEGDVGQRLILSDDLLDGFAAWQRARGNTSRHVNSLVNRLRDWQADLAGKDLRRLSLGSDVKPALARRGTCRPRRIIALKVFCAWLRTERHLLTTAEDATLDLPVPQARPEKMDRRKVVEWASLAAAAEHLKQRPRDFLTLLVATGWHTTEAERFVRSKAGVILKPPGGPLAVLVTRHKGGDFTRTPIVHAEHLEAVERLKKAGKAPRRINDALRAACAEAGVAPFTAGVLRHSVATWAVEQGARPSDVSEFLGHKDARTTRRFYIDSSAPTVSVPTRTLH